MRCLPPRPPRCRAESGNREIAYAHFVFEFVWVCCLSQTQGITVSVRASKCSASPHRWSALGVGVAAVSIGFAENTANVLMARLVGSDVSL